MDALGHKKSPVKKKKIAPKMASENEFKKRGGHL